LGSSERPIDVEEIVNNSRKGMTPSVWAAIAGAVAVLVGPAAAREDAEPFDAPEGVQVLTRGPVHEAFAEPVVFNPEPGPVVPEEPPQPVEEVPPDQKP
jgi:hypothetical protein